MTPRQGILICAHRGASGQAPENTLAALRLALDQGADMAEVDVQRTGDGHLVLFHDDTLERTSDGKGRLASHSLAELRTLDAGSWFGPQFAGERIPSLAEVLALAGADFPLNLELKGPPEDLALAEDVAALLAAGGIAPASIVTSFSRELVDRLKSRLPGQTTGLIIGGRGLQPRDLASDHEILSVPYPQLDAACLARAAGAGKRVHVWTVDRRREVLRAAALGVEAVITNQPAQVAAWLARR